MERLEHDKKLAVEWFENDYKKLNEDKFHLLVAGHRYETLWPNIGETRVWKSKNEKLLGLTIDRNLNFDDQEFTLCKKAGRKLSVLSRISNYMGFEKKSFEELLKKDKSFCIHRNIQSLAIDLFKVKKQPL